MTRGSPQLAAPEAISGAEAYQRYVAHAMPFLREAGSEVLFGARVGRH